MQEDVSGEEERRGQGVEEIDLQGVHQGARSRKLCLIQACVSSGQIIESQLHPISCNLTTILVGLKLVDADQKKYSVNFSGCCLPAGWIVG